MEIKNYLGEVWRPIKGYEGLYEVSNFGRVKSLNYAKKGKERIMKNSFIRGYCVIKINGKMRYVHRLVAEAFLPNPNNYPVINHKDEIRSHNFVWVNEDGSVDQDKSNLEWCTQKHNVNWGTAPERRRKKLIGHPCFQETRDKIGLANKGRDRSKHIEKLGKKVQQITLEGKCVSTFPSVRSVEKNLGYCEASVRRCCLGKQKTAYGFIWRFVY